MLLTLKTLVKSPKIKTTSLIFMVLSAFIIGSCKKELNDPIIASTSNETPIGWSYEEISSKITIVDSSPILNGYGIENSLDGNLYDDYSAADLSTLPQYFTLKIDPPKEISAIELVWLSVKDYSTQYSIDLYGTSGKLASKTQTINQEGIDHLIPLNSTEPVERVSFKFVSFSGQQRLLLKQIRLLHLDYIDRTKNIEIPIRHLDCLNEKLLNLIRAKPNSVIQLYQDCRKDFTELLNDKFPNISEDIQSFLFDAVISSQLAPYGNSDTGRTTLDLNGLLHIANMQCTQYVSLTYLLNKQNSISNHSSLDIVFVGWAGGIITNHTQIFVTDRVNRQTFLLDPTIGLVALANFNQVASGQPVNPNNILEYDSPNRLMEFSQLIIESLVKGLYKPSDLLYYTDSFNDFVQIQNNDLIYSPAYIKMQDPTNAQ